VPDRNGYVPPLPSQPIKQRLSTPMTYKLTTDQLLNDPCNILGTDGLKDRG